MGRRSAVGYRWFRLQSAISCLILCSAPVGDSALTGVQSRRSQTLEMLVGPCLRAQLPQQRQSTAFAYPWPLIPGECGRCSTTNHRQLKRRHVLPVPVLVRFPAAAPAAARAASDRDRSATKDSPLDQCTARCTAASHELMREPLTPAGRAGQQPGRPIRHSCRDPW